MFRRFSRRAALRAGGLGTLSLIHPPFLAGCSSNAGSTETDGEPELPPLVYDPNRSWWMQHNYAPVGAERDSMDLEVEGAIPPELDGLYLRNGSNPKNGDPGHWFLGNGMLHGVRLSGGNARWYANRYVRTPLLDREPNAGDESVGPPALEDTASNVSLIEHAGRVLSLGEVGYPYEVSADDLSTIGLYDFEGKLATSMTAHPKLDPATGEMLMFAYGFSAPFLTFHQVDAKGALVRSEPIDLPAPVMMHDFQITESHVVFMDLPILFDLGMALEGSRFPFRWDAGNGARLGIMPRSGGPLDITWVEIETCFIFHTLNAFDDAGKVVLEACRYPELWVNGPETFDSFPRLHRYVIDPAAKTASLDMVDDRLLEFPQVDRRRMGRKHRYGYGLWLADRDGKNHPNGVRGIVKFDRERDTTAVHEVDPALTPDEAFFVPASADSAEDEGWLLSYVYDRRTDKTALHIVDASDVAAPPVAKVKLPFRVPFGFHGLWVPA